MLGRGVDDLQPARQPSVGSGSAQPANGAVYGHLRRWTLCAALAVLWWVSLGSSCGSARVPADLGSFISSITDRSDQQNFTRMALYGVLATVLYLSLQYEAEGTGGLSTAVMLVAIGGVRYAAGLDRLLWLVWWALLLTTQGSLVEDTWAAGQLASRDSAQWDVQTASSTAAPASWSCLV